MKLKKIAEVKTGLVISRKRADNRVGSIENYKLLNLNAIDKYGNLIREELEDFESIDKLEEHYFTKKGDILIRLNEPFTSFHINKKMENLLIPSYFVKVRITNKNYIPEFLAWYLNSEKTKREYLKEQSGTLVASINQKIINELNIPEFDLEKQRIIGEIYKLFKEERKLLANLIEEKERRFKGVTEKLLRNQEEEKWEKR